MRAVREELIRPGVMAVIEDLVTREASGVTAIRFTPAPVSWTGLFPRLGVDEVRAAAVGQAGEMAERGLAPTTAVAQRCLASLVEAGLCVPVTAVGKPARAE